MIFPFLFFIIIDHRSDIKQTKQNETRQTKWFLSRIIYAYDDDDDNNNNGNKEKFWKIFLVIFFLPGNDHSFIHSFNV